MPKYDPLNIQADGNIQTDGLIRTPKERPEPPRRVYAAMTALSRQWVTLPAALTKSLLLYTERRDLEDELRRIVTELGKPGRLWREWYTVVPMDFGEACELNVRIMDEHAQPLPEDPAGWRLP